MSRARFGQPVAGLVGALTEDESIKPFERRKDEHRDHVEAFGGDAVAIYAADKLTNISVLRRTIVEEGESAGEEFEVPLDVKVEVWTDDLAMLRRRGSRAPLRRRSRRRAGAAAPGGSR